MREGHLSLRNQAPASEKQFRAGEGSDIIKFASEATGQGQAGPGSLGKSEGLRQDSGLSWALSVVGD